MKKPIALVVLVLLAFAVLVSGCGGSEKPTPPAVKAAQIPEQAKQNALPPSTQSATVDIESDIPHALRALTQAVRYEPIRPFPYRAAPIREMLVKELEEGAVDDSFPLKPQRIVAEIRAALDDAAPLYRDAPEAEEARAAGDRVIEAFMRDVLPDASDATRELAGDLVMTTMSTVGKEFSEESLSAADISAYADAMADMFCAYLGNHGLGRRPGR